MEINWTLLAYIMVGIFVMSGFFKGWWKEAITTFFLAILIFFLSVPTVAGWFVDIINTILDTVWDFLPTFLLGGSLAPIQLDASDGGMWLIILLIFVGLAIFISRATLPSGDRGNTYVVTPIGSILGAVLGGLNGFLIMNLVREYLDGRNLPSRELATEVTTAAGDIVGTASSGVAIRVTDLPDFTIFNAFLPWIIITVGLLIFFLALRGRKTPWDYVEIQR